MRSWVGNRWYLNTYGRPCVRASFKYAVWASEHYLNAQAHLAESPVQPWWSLVAIAQNATRPSFAKSIREISRLYTRNSTMTPMVLCVDEKTSLQPRPQPDTHPTCSTQIAKHPRFMFHHPPVHCSKGWIKSSSGSAFSNVSVCELLMHADKQALQSD